MYSSAFCKVYNEFGWNYFPEAFGEQLLLWIGEKKVPVRTSLDLACGTGVLCEILHKNGIKASGMDFSEGMIEIAQKSNPEIFYEVADMITYRPDAQFDLVTCTGDALNHIMDLKDVEQIFQNVYGYLKKGAYFVFDLLNEQEVPMSEPFDLEFDEHVKAVFLVTRDEEGRINLKTSVYEDGVFQFEEVIKETLHDPSVIVSMLERVGFRTVQISDRLIMDSPAHSTTWFVVAQK